MSPTGLKKGGGTPASSVITCGLDIGSVMAKAVVMAGGRVLGRAARPTGTDIPRVAEQIATEALEQAGQTLRDVSRFVATGYGRVNVPLADKQVTEITCCARGVHHLYPAARTVIDIGGQDTKVIRLDDQGRVVNFGMNDKCAAGTGRFLEVAAQTLGVSVEDLGELSLKSQHPASMSSTCTVFAQSEIVSLIMQKALVVDIIAGLHQAIVNRVFGLASSVGLKEAYIMVGGVAQNTGVVRAMAARLGRPLHVPEAPQYVVATGAALTA
ncbi:MAG: acyl-CoA dehydratase activase [Chloroflexota bacterium]